MIKYTKRQREAINYFKSNLLISASAGSGKTQVLLEKVVKLIENGESLNNILMVTFTNLAASEMKAKLENILLDKINNDERSNSSKFFDALNLLNACDISTLHSFCQKLVREFYYKLNLEPDFEIGEDSVLIKLKHLALNETIDYYLSKNDEEFKNLSNLFVYKRDYSLFKNEILAFYNFLVSKPNKFDFAKKMIEKSCNEKIEENEIIEKFKNLVVLKLNPYIEVWKDFEVKAKNIGSDTLKNIAISFYGNIDNNFTTNKDFIEFCMQKLEFPRISIKKNAISEEVELKEEMQNSAKELKEELKNINKIFSETDLTEVKNSLIENKKILTKLINIVKKFEENYLKHKTLNNILDFNDLEDLTLKLLNMDEILLQIQNKYKYVFVDEYQDTNSIQEEILSKISKQSKRIMVGDVKQSIYAFRECNPKIFNSKLEDYSKNKKNGKVVFLNKNFRSCESILNFSNIVFSNLMKEENSTFNYYDISKFVAGIKENNLQNTLKPVEILCIEKENKKKKVETETNETKENATIENEVKNETNKKSESGDENKISKNLELLDTSEENEEELSKENLLVVNSIFNLLNQKIIENNLERNLTFSDILVISRKRNEKIIELCNYLDEFKIPYKVKYKEQIYKKNEVKLILSYLKLLKNLDNDISLTSILTNVYGLSNNDLLTIKTTSVLESVKNYNKKDEILDKITQFFNDYNYFKAQLGEITIKELIENIIIKLNLEIILLKTFGKISLERLNIFLENIPNNLYSLFDFLIFILENENLEFEVNKITGENAITIDTFHSTKGLEYNAVIIYSSGDEIFSKNRSNLIYNAEIGAGVYNFDLQTKIKKPSCVFNMINELNKLEELNEEIRLSYVAFTRAKNFLIIIGKEKVKNMQSETIPINFLNFNSYLSLVFSVDFNNLTKQFDCFLNKKNINDEIINNIETIETSEKEKLEELNVFDKAKINNEDNLNIFDNIENNDNTNLNILENTENEKIQNSLKDSKLKTTVFDNVENTELNIFDTVNKKQNENKHCEENLIDVKQNLKQLKATKLVLTSGKTKALNKIVEDFNIQIIKSDSEIFENIKNDLNNKILNKNNNNINSCDETNKNLDFSVFNNIKSKNYNYNSSVNIALKNSVTSISNEDKQIYNISNFKLTDNDEEDFIELGNAYHSALENLPFHLNSKAEVRNKMKELIELNKVSANIYSYVDDEKLFSAISQIKPLISGNAKVYKEHTFMMYINHNKIKKSGVEDKILVQGVIDLFIEKDDEIILVDYKTSRLNSVNLIKKYDIQLSLYTLALKEKFKDKKISKYIYSIFLDKLIKIV